jgi:gas vesicle protein
MDPQHTLTVANYLALPASTFAIIGIVGVLKLQGRRDQRMDDVIKTTAEHTNVLKDCAAKGFVSSSQCKETQAVCIKQQRVANKQISEEIKELKEEIRRNRIELKHEAEVERKEVREVLRRLSGDVGAISGIVGKFRFDREGKLVL